MISMEGVIGTFEYSGDAPTAITGGTESMMKETCMVDSFPARSVALIARL